MRGSCGHKAAIAIRSKLSNTIVCDLWLDQVMALNDGDMAVGQHQWYHVGAPPIFVYFCGDWDVHRGYDLAFDAWPYD